MELSQAIKARFSIRKFLEQEVTDELIGQIIELAKLAPSAGNLQAYQVIIVRDPEIKKRLYPIEAPVFLIICALPEVSAKRYGDRGQKLYSIQDATIFASYLQLIAVNQGLATVWVGAFRESRVQKLLGLTPDLKPIAIIPLGYPAEDKTGKRRRKLKEIIRSKPDSNKN